MLSSGQLVFGRGAHKNSTAMHYLWSGAARRFLGTNIANSTGCVPAGTRHSRLQFFRNLGMNLCLVICFSGYLLAVLEAQKLWPLPPESKFSSDNGFYIMFVYLPNAITFITACLKAKM